MRTTYFVIGFLVTLAVSISGGLYVKAERAEKAELVSMLTEVNAMLTRSQDQTARAVAVGEEATKLADEAMAICRRFAP